MSAAGFGLPVLGSPMPSRRPSTSTRVRCGPRPRRSTVLDAAGRGQQGPRCSTGQHSELNDLRQIVEQIQRVGLALELELHLAHRLDRADAGQIGLRDARSRDHQRFDVGLGHLRVLRKCLTSA